MLFQVNKLYSSKNTLIFLFRGKKLRKKGLKRARNAGVREGGFGFMRHRMALIGGDRRQTTNGRFDQNIIPEHFPAHAPPAHRTRFPRLARALNFDLERAPKKVHSFDPRG